MSFSVLGVKFNVSVPFAVVVAFLLLMDNTSLMSASLFAVVVHEIGHLIVMKKQGVAPKSINFTAAGILICGNAFFSVKQGIVIALAGPISNIVFTVCFYISGVLFKSDLLIIFAAVQLLVGLINLLPIKGLDGGTVLINLFYRLNLKNADMILSLVSIITAVLVTVLGTAIMVRNVGNPSLMLLGIYLIILNILKS